MSQEERYGERDLSYSAWHRVRSISRYVGLEAAQNLKMGGGKGRRPGGKAGISHGKACSAVRSPGFRGPLRGRVATEPGRSATIRYREVRVKRIWPTPEHVWRTLTPADWAEGLLQIRSWSAAKLEIEAANDRIWEPIPTQKELFA